MVYVQIIFILLLPIALLRLELKWKWWKAIVMAYVFGVVVGNVVPQLLDVHVLSELTGLSIILAIPLMLFPTQIKQWSAQPKSLLVSYILAVVATSIAVAVGWILFKDSLPEIAIISGMIEGVYTGGTINLNAIGLAFEASNSLMVLLNGYDMAFSGIYLLGIFTLLPRVLGYILPSMSTNPEIEERIEEYGFLELTLIQKFKSGFSALALAGMVLGVVAGISIFITGEMQELILVFGVSLVALALSNIKLVRAIKGNMFVADYLMMVFGFTLGAQANIMDLVNEQSGLLSYFLITYLLMLLVHVLLARIFKIDVATFLVSSTAAVFGPPFIGPVSESLGKRALIAPGIVVALMGNAIGTYLGIAVVQFLL